MKTLDSWLTEYAVSHQNPTNILIHMICVPLIVFSIFGMIYSIPGGIVLFLPGGNATVMAAFLTVYYFRLSWRGALYFAASAAASIALINFWDLQLGYVLHGSITIFILAWVGQFIGHKIEGKKPSFLEDLRFLLIGPLFVLKHFGTRL